MDTDNMICLFCSQVQFKSMKVKTTVSKTLKSFGNLDCGTAHTLQNN